MPRVIYVQLTGVEKAARILAETVSEQKSAGHKDDYLVLRNDDAEVGKFRLGHVVGWWIQEES